MKLYYAKGACSLAVRIAVHELHLPCEFEAVNLKTKLTDRGLDFTKINPKGAVPTLMLDNQEVLTENTVIQQYLADSNKGNQLLPAIGDFKRYRVLEWLNFVSTELYKSFPPLFNSQVPEDVKEQVFRPALKNKLSFVNDHLNKNKFLAGNDFTLADSYLYVILRGLPHLKINIDEMTALTHYFKELSQRPSIQQSLQEEGLV